MALVVIIGRYSKRILMLSATSRRRRSILLIKGQFLQGGGVTTGGIVTKLSKGTMNIIEKYVIEGRQQQ